MRCDNLFFYAVLLGFNSWLTVCNGTILNSNEKEAKQFALETSDNIFKFYDALRLDTNLINDSENQNRTQNILNEAQFLVDIVQKAKKFDFKNFKDQELKRAFEAIVRISDEMVIGAEQFLEIWNSLIELKELEAYTSYDCFKECGGNGSSIGAGEVMQLMTNSENPEELEHYWKQVRKTTAEWAKKNMHMLVDGLKKAANLT
ncbi:angiotensin-converting enzyme-like, partial [Eupeodes corollae]|uniref:angiotensin-converting enzyme-like n=1 Tax=Eupeodes corollae TaxID=290404 RepID=UPI002492A646